MAVTPAKNWMGDYSGLPVHFYRLKDSNGNITVNERPQMGKLAVDGHSVIQRLNDCRSILGALFAMELSADKSSQSIINISMLVSGEQVAVI